MQYRENCIIACPYRVAVRKGGFFYAVKGMMKDSERGEAEYSGWQTRRNYRANLATASFRTARPGLAVSGKIILAALRYFSRKPCISGGDS